jgi:integrase
MHDSRFTKDWLLQAVDDIPGKRTEYKDAENRYLRLVVHPTGKARLCVYKCPRGSKSAVRVGLPYAINSEMPSMQRIRREANQIIAVLDQGINPNTAKKTSDKPLSLQEALDNYLRDTSNTERVANNWRRAIETHLKYWLSKPLFDLCHPESLYTQHRRIMAEISQENAKKGLSGNGGIGANEVLKKVRRILNFNRALDQRFELPRWPTEELGAKGLKMWIEQKPRKRRIHREEFPSFWAGLNSLACPLQRDLFKFILLTGCRSNEARSLDIQDINWMRRSATFKNTKNGTDHTIPLTDTLIELISERMRVSKTSKLFPLASPKAVTKNLEKSCGLHLSPQDLRRTFAGIAESVGIGSTTKKDLLNHLSGRDVTDDYTGQTDFEDLRHALQLIETKILSLSNESLQDSQNGAPAIWNSHNMI